MSKIRVVHYINQFFSGIGGEEMAHIEPELRNELPPISQQLQGQLGEEYEVVGTVICGDSYFNENLEKALINKGFKQDDRGYALLEETLYKVMEEMGALGLIAILNKNMSI